MRSFKLFRLSVFFPDAYPSKDMFEDFETRHSLVKDVEATTKARFGCLSSLKLQRRKMKGLLGTLFCFHSFSTNSPRFFPPQFLSSPFEESLSNSQVLFSRCLLRFLSWHTSGSSSVLVTIVGVHVQRLSFRDDEHPYGYTAVSSRQSVRIGILDGHKFCSVLHRGYVAIGLKHVAATTERAGTEAEELFREFHPATSSRCTSLLAPTLC